MTRYLRLGRRVGRIHWGQWNVRRVDRHHYGLVRRGRLWVLPAVEGTIKRGDRTLTLHRRVAHLKLRRGHCNGTGGKDIRIGKLRIETHGGGHLRPPPKHNTRRDKCTICRKLFGLGKTSGSGNQPDRKASTWFHLVNALTPESCRRAVQRSLRDAADAAWSAARAAWPTAKVTTQRREGRPHPSLEPQHLVAQPARAWLPPPAFRPLRRA
eukprot:scaffold8263_cov104-Isochrysis_galbana.AAC.11